MRELISPASSATVRVVLITLDNHIAAAVDDARASLSADLPGLALSVHAATDWANDPQSLADRREAIRTGDIIIVSMIFIEEHVRAIADALEARHLDCDAMVCCMSAGTIMKYTAMGRFRMAGEQKGPLALLKKLRGGSSGKNGESGRTAGERQMAMLRRLPKLLKYIPGTAQDVRCYFLTLQYRLAASAENVDNMVRMLVGKYASGERKALRDEVVATAPTEYPDRGLYHPRSSSRVSTRLKDLPRVDQPRGRIGLLLLRTYILSGDTGHYDGVIAALENQGFDVVPVFSSGLDMRAAITEFMTDGNGAPTIDALCSLTGFSLVGGPAYSDAAAAAEVLQMLDVPYLSACVSEFQTRDVWQASTQGLTPLEAMASGSAVVASDAGAFAEMVLPGETGDVVAADDGPALTAAIRPYLADPSLAQAHGRNALAHVRQHFPLVREADGVVAVYNRLWAMR